MTLILQIALGMLLGYILIENRHAMLRMAGGLVALILVLAIVAAILAGVWYVGHETLTAAVGDYDSAGVIGQKFFFGIGVLLFLLLTCSMLLGLWVFASLLVPKAFLRFCRRFKKPRTPIAFVTLIIAATAFALGYQVTAPGILGSWERAWTEWGLSHGMGYDGGSTFDLLLWQAIWVANYLLFRLRGSDPFNDLELALGSEEDHEAAN
jgi:hypothetical protein